MAHLYADWLLLLKIRNFIFGGSLVLAFNALVDQFPQNHYLLNSQPGCPPLVKEDYSLLTDKYPHRKACIALNDSLLYGNSDLSKTDLIVINAVFSAYRPEHLSRAIAKIRTYTQVPIVVFGNYLFFSEDVPNLIVRHGSTVLDDFYKSRMTWNSLAFDDELTSLSNQLGFTYISKRKLFCTDGSITSCPLIFDGKLFTYDQHHLSLSAARALGRAINDRYPDLFNIQRSH